VTSFIPRWFTRPQTVTRQSTNPAVKLTTCWSQVRHPNHYTIKVTISERTN